MPKIVKIFGYKIYFYANEGNEPCHVHISKDNKNSSKIWIEPEIKIEHNNAKISKKVLKDIIEWLNVHRDDVLQQWNKFFGN